MIELRVEDEAGSPVRSQCFESSEISIGRAPTNDLVLASAAVSSRHARLFRNDGSWMLEDSKSTNGTVLNGAVIAQPTPVRDGDCFEIGEFRLRLVVAGGAAAAAEGDVTLIGARPAEAATPVAAATAAEPGGDPVREIKGRLHKRADRVPRPSLGRPEQARRRGHPGADAQRRSRTSSASSPGRSRPGLNRERPHQADHRRGARPRAARRPCSPTTR